MVHWERIGPVLCGFGIGGGYACYLAWSGAKLPDATKDILTSVISVASTALAFVATLQGFVFSMDDSPIIKRLVQLRAYRTFLGYFSAAIWACLLTTLLSIGLLFCGLDGSSTLVGKATFVALLATAGWTMGTCLRIILLFQVILHRRLPPETE